MQTIISRGSILLMLLILINTQTWSQGQEKGSSPTVKNEEYPKLVSEYYDLTKRHNEILEKARNSDPALKRAMDWLGNERLEVSTPFAKEDREFFSKFQNDDDKKLYREWQQSLAAKIHLEVFEKEWKEHLESHEALLFWAGMLIKRFSKNPDSKVKDNSVPEMSGSEESQWSEFLNYAKRRDAQNIGKISDIVEKLHIPKNLINNYEKTLTDTALFNVYDTYYHLNYPEELKNIEKEQTKIHNQLTEINPNWVYDEKLELRNEEYKRFQVVPVARSPFSWFLMGLGAVLIVIVAVRIYLRRRF
jgi:hypothetical protein